MGESKDAMTTTHGLNQTITYGWITCDPMGSQLETPVLGVRIGDSEMCPVDWIIEGSKGVRGAVDDNPRATLIKRLREGSLAMMREAFEIQRAGLDMNPIHISNSMARAANVLEHGSEE